MKREFNTLIIIICFACTLFSSCSDDETLTDNEVRQVALSDLKVSSFNIRFSNPGDGINRWSNRRTDVLNFLKVENLDIIGMQEALHSQIEFFDNNLTGYTRIGVGREDGKEAGEYAPIYVKSSRFNEIEKGNFWLSETPSVPSRGWDAVLNRICTYTHVLDLETDQEVFVFNTHYDHVGAAARVNSSSLILDSIQAKLDKNIRVILTGDLNVEPSATAYQLLTDRLEDSFDTNVRFGPFGTFNGFNVGENHDRRIDYILFNGFKSNSYATISTVINGRYLSDHFPIISKLAYRPLNN